MFLAILLPAAWIAAFQTPFLWAVGRGVGVSLAFNLPLHIDQAKYAPQACILKTPSALLAHVAFGVVAPLLVYKWMIGHVKEEVRRRKSAQPVDTWQSALIREVSLRYAHVNPPLFCMNTCRSI